MCFDAVILHTEEKAKLREKYHVESIQLSLELSSKCIHPKLYNYKVSKRYTKLLQKSLVLIGAK